MGKPGDAKNKFYDKKDVISLAEYLLRYPCCAYIHLPHAIMHKRLKTYIFRQKIMINGKEKIDAYSFPVKYMVHDYICKYFSCILFEAKSILKLEPYIREVSVLPPERALTYDFCAPDTLPKIAPQLAYVLSEFASKRTDEAFSAEKARDIFYSSTIDVCSHTPPMFSRDRSEWELPMDDLWLEPQLKEYALSKDFKRSRLLPSYRDALVKGGVTSAEAFARIADTRFPGQINDHEMGELVLPLSPPRKSSRELDATKEYGRVRQKGFSVRQKYKKRTI